MQCSRFSNRLSCRPTEACGCRELSSDKCLNCVNNDTERDSDEDDSN